MSRRLCLAAALIPLLSVLGAGCSHLGAATLSVSDGLALGNASSGGVRFHIDASKLFSGSGSGGRRTQYVQSDAQLLVVGLYDTSAAPQLGQEISSASVGSVAVSTSAPSYQAAIVGTDGGAYSAGALDLGGTGLSDAEKVNFRRCLYSDIAVPLALPTSDTLTFDDVPPGSGRYIAFAAALSSASFDTSYPASDSYVIGLATTSISVTAGNTTTASLALGLNRDIAPVTLNATVSTGTLNNLSNVQELIVGILATNSVSIPAGTLQPLSLGYRYEYLAGSSTSTLYTTAPTSPADYFSNLENNIKAVDFTDLTTWQRYFWVRKSYTTTNALGTALQTNATLSVSLTNVPQSLSSEPGDYCAYALAFDTGTGADTFSTLLGSATTSFALGSSGATVNLPTVNLAP